MQSILEKTRNFFSRPQPSVPPIVESDIQADEQPSTKELIPVRNGYVTIHDGQIVVTDPDEKGSFATILVPEEPGCTVLVGGRIVTGLQVVHSDELIEVKVDPIAPSSHFSMSVTTDSMEVVGTIKIHPGEQCRLKDLSETHHAILEFEKVPLSPEPLSQEELEAVILAAGYVGELDRAAVAFLANSIGTVSIPVLKGSTMQPGKQARFELAKHPKVYDPLHRRMEISTVPAGTTIATLHPETLGTPGKDVFGRTVPCPKHKPLPQLGQGVANMAGRIVALLGGRVVFTKSLIDVVPELVINHDLSSKDGRIEFDGNVTVFGSILDESVVRAAGKVKVYGRILDASVSGERGVFTEGAIIGSQISAGQSRELYAKVQPVIKRCLSELGRFSEEYTELLSQVKDRADLRGHIPMLAGTLLEKRHVTLAQLLEYLSEDFDHLIQEDDRYHSIVLQLRSKWTGIGRTNIIQNDITKLQQALEDYNIHVESIIFTELAEVRAESITSSSIRSSGNIVITGAGTYASSLEAGDSIISRGTSRGGFMIAQNSIIAHEIGTQSGTESSLKVCSPTGRIRIGIRHPNTVIQVGSYRDRNLVAEYDVVHRGDGHAN